MTKRLNRKPHLRAHTYIEQQPRSFDNKGFPSCTLLLKTPQLLNQLLSFTGRTLPDTDGNFPPMPLAMFISTTVSVVLVLPAGQANQMLSHAASSANAG